MIKSKFLRKEDFDDDVPATISSCEKEELPSDGGGTRECWLLGFTSLPKKLVLNVTMIRVLERAFGTDSDDWIGKKVILYSDPGVTFMGKVVGGVRLRPVVAKLAKQSLVAVAAAKAKEAAPEFDDDIPFGDERGKEAS
jgi:hypothetical protein